MLEDTGALSAEECKRATPFCLSACSAMSERLRDAKYEDEPAVITACAALALYSFTLLKLSSGEEFSSFKAGDITVSKSAGADVENAVKFRDEALLNAANYLKDVDFVFRAVEI